MNPDTPLLTIFESQYVPEKYADYPRRAANRRMGLNWLRDHLGRAPTLKDMTSDTVEGAMKSAAERGRSKGTIFTVRHGLISFWRWLGERKYVSNAPERTGKYYPRKREPEKRIHVWGERSTPPDPTGTRYRKRTRPVIDPFQSYPKPADGSAPLMDLFRFYAYRRLRGSAENTITKYLGVLMVVAKVLGREPTIADLNDETVENCMWYVRQRGRSIPTANAHRSKLLALFSLAFKHRLIDGTLDVPKMKAPRRIPTAWTQHDLAKLFDACQRQRGTISGIPASAWLQALLMVLYDCGERISATLAIEWGWINFSSGYVHVPAEVRKGNSGDMMHKLHPDTITLLMRIREPHRTLVFPWDRSIGTLWARYREILKDAGLPHGRRDLFHKMRRTTASFTKLCGGDAQAALGHFDAATTAAYIAPDIAGVVQPVDLIPRPVKVAKLIAAELTESGVGQ